MKFLNVFLILFIIFPLDTHFAQADGAPTVFLLLPDQFILDQTFGVPAATFYEKDLSIEVFLSFKASYENSERFISSQYGGDLTKVRFVEVPVLPKDFHFIGDFIENNPSLIRSIEFETYPNILQVKISLTREYSLAEIQSFFLWRLYTGHLRDMCRVDPY